MLEEHNRKFSKSDNQKDSGNANIQKVKNNQPSTFSIQISVGVDHEFVLQLQQQIIALQSNAKSLSNYADLKKYRGFYSSSPECRIKMKQRTQKWDFKKPFRIGNSSGNLYITDVKLVASSRKDVTIHPDRNNNIVQSKNSLVWDKNVINLADHAIGAGAYIIEIYFSEQNPDLTGKTAYVSRHNLITK